MERTGDRSSSILSSFFLYFRSPQLVWTKATIKIIGTLTQKIPVFIGILWLQTSWWFSISISMRTFKHIYSLLDYTHRHVLVSQRRRRRRQTPNRYIHSPDHRLRFPIMGNQNYEYHGPEQIFSDHTPRPAVGIKTHPATKIDRSAVV